MRASPVRRNPVREASGEPADARCTRTDRYGVAGPERYQERRIAISALVARYGLWAILVGAGLEGEAVVLTGGVLAHQGLLPFWGVAACATVGSLLVDQFWFAAGRWSRDRAWVRRLTAKAGFKRALHLLERHSTAFILSFRFIYGLRTASPIAIGTSAVPTRRFVVLNAISAAAWGPIMAALGYGLGRSLGSLARHLHDGALPWLLVGVAVLLVAAGLWRWRSHRPVIASGDHQAG